MRVLYIPSGDDKYGAPKSMMELISRLHDRHGIDPIVMTCHQGMINEWCDRKGFENHVLGQGSFMVVGGSNWVRKIVKHGLYPYLRYKYLSENAKARKKIEEVVQANTIDIIHTNVNRVDIGGYYSLAHHIPHVWHLREFGKEDYNCMYLRRDAISFMNKSTTEFIAISEAVKKAWIEKGLDRDKINVIYNGIDLSLYSKDNTIENNNNDKLKIVFAGIISETKGQIQLIKAIELLPPEKKEKVQVDLYGGGREEYINKLKRYVHKAGLDYVVSFKGYSKELHKVYPLYNVGIVSSRAEAFGRVTAEYMAAELCVIASDTGANPEVIKDHGYLYKYGNVSELSSIISKLADNPLLATEIGKKASEYVRGAFSIDRCADEVYALYKAVLGL